MSHAPLTRRPDPPHLSVLVVRPAAGAQTLLAAFARRRGDRAGRGDALAHARRRRAVRGARVGGSSRCTSAGTAAVFFCHFLFSRPVAGLRPRLASSLRSPRPAERGRGARGAKGDARGARTSRVALAAAAQPGHRAPRWSSPPGPLLSSSRPSLRARAAPPARRRGARAPRAGARTRAERNATGAARGESERGTPSELAARGFARRVCVFLGFAALLSPLCARAALSSRSPRSGERSLRASARRTRCATHATRPARGERAPPALSE